MNDGRSLLCWISLLQDVKIFLNALDVVSHQIPEVIYHATPSGDFFAALLASDFQKGKRDYQ
jgi:hypothetical protein